MGLGRLDGRVAVVTGGARGQGLATAAKLADEGAYVTICDVCEPIETAPYALSTEANLESARRLIESSGRRCLAIKADVRDAAALNGVAATTMDAFGRIDILCANAGIGSFGSTLELKQAEWDDVIAVNLTGVWNSVRAVAPTMVAQSSGSIIVTASINAHEPAPDLPHYVASKHGVLGLMRQFAYEFAPFGVRVNAVSPGPILSPMMDNPASRNWVLQREGATTQDVIEATRNWTAMRGRTAMPPTVIADAAVWLASDESCNVTGIEITVDAGHSVLPGMNLAPQGEPMFGPKDFESTALGTPGPTISN